MKILVPVGADFNDFHLIDGLLGRGDQVNTIDDLNAYYSPKIIVDRLAVMSKLRNLHFISLHNQISLIGR
jgi:hypothetical protein